MPKQPETTYRGQPIKGHAVSLSGRIAKAVTVDNLDIGDEVQMLVTGIVTGVAHKKDEKLGGLVRSPKVTISEAHMLGDDDGITLLLELRQRDEEMLDAMLGRQKLDGFDAHPDVDRGTGEMPPRDSE